MGPRCPVFPLKKKNNSMVLKHFILPEEHFKANLFLLINISQPKKFYRKKVQLFQRFKLFSTQTFFLDPSSIVKYSNLILLIKSKLKYLGSEKENRSQNVIEFGCGCKKALVFLTEQLRAFIDLAFFYYHISL